MERRRGSHCLKTFGINCMKDRFDRTINYMRVSIKDRCDLRCRYCMPYGCDKVSMDQILTCEEIGRICRVGAGKANGDKS